MPYTRHGYWFGPGEPTEPGPRLVAKCGGPGMCGVCSREAGPGDSASRDQLKAAIRQHEDLLASIVLYIKWRYVTKQLTTEQKDLFADSLERHAIREHGPVGEDSDSEMAGLPSYAPRWWRSPEEDQPGRGED